MGKVTYLLEFDSVVTSELRMCQTMLEVESNCILYMCICSICQSCSCIGEESVDTGLKITSVAGVPKDKRKYEHEGTSLTNDTRKDRLSMHAWPMIMR